jgi:hypothetical protein
LGRNLESVILFWALITQNENHKRLVKNFILKERRLNFPTEGIFRLFFKDAPYPNWRCAYRCVRTIFQHTRFIINGHRRLGGSRISLAPLGFAGAKPRLAAALAGCLLANFIACAAQLGAAAGCGRPQPPRPQRQVTTSKKQKFIRVRPLCRN